MANTTWWQAAIRLRRRKVDDFDTWWEWDRWTVRQIRRAERDSAVLGGLAVLGLALLMLAILAGAVHDLLLA